MAVPWLRLLKAVVGVTDFALTRHAASRADYEEEGRRASGSGGLGHLDTRLAAVVVAALREAFDRDSRRLELEREQAEAERQRAERALRLELLRRAGERELERLRLLAGVAALSWISSLFVAATVVGGHLGARIMLGSAWAVLLGALAAAFVGQSSIGAALADIDRLADFGAGSASPTHAGTVALWLTLIGLGLVALAILTA